MTNIVMDALGVNRPEADRLRKHYWHSYGTTLAGLMREHDVDPAPYLIQVHDISMDHLEQDAALRAHIGDLPGRRIVYTNGTAPYAERVLAARGLAGLFDAVYGVEHAGFSPKPSAPPLRRCLPPRRHRTRPRGDVRGRSAQPGHAHGACRPQGAFGKPCPSSYRRSDGIPENRYLKCVIATICT